jgi:photoactive yellow protein
VLGDDIDERLSDENLQRMSESEFDALPFGAIRLDGHNRVELYNAAEADIARRDATQTIGRDFFVEVAPCTNTVDFRGTLDDLVRSGRKNARINYRFRFPWGYRDVRIQFWVPRAAERWIFVVPLDAA